MINTMSTVVTFVLLFFVVSDFVEWHVFLIRKIKIKNKIQRLKKKKEPLLRGTKMWAATRTIQTSQGQRFNLGARAKESGSAGPAASAF